MALNKKQFYLFARNLRYYNNKPKSLSVIHKNICNHILLEIQQYDNSIKNFNRLNTDIMEYLFFDLIGQYYSSTFNQSFNFLDVLSKNRENDITFRHDIDDEYLTLGFGGNKWSKELSSIKDKLLSIKFISKDHPKGGASNWVNPKGFGQYSAIIFLKKNDLISLYANYLDTCQLAIASKTNQLQNLADFKQSKQRFEYKIVWDFFAIYDAIYNSLHCKVIAYRSPEYAFPLTGNNKQKKKFPSIAMNFPFYWSANKFSEFISMQIPIDDDNSSYIISPILSKDKKTLRFQCINSKDGLPIIQFSSYTNMSNFLSCVKFNNHDITVNTVPNKPTITIENTIFNKKNIGFRDSINIQYSGIDNCSLHAIQKDYPLILGYIKESTYSFVPFEITDIIVRYYNNKVEIKLNSEIYWHPFYHCNNNKNNEYSEHTSSVLQHANKKNKTHLNNLNLSAAQEKNHLKLSSFSLRNNINNIEDKTSAYNLYQKHLDGSNTSRHSIRGKKCIDHILDQDVRLQQARDFIKYQIKNGRSNLNNNEKYCGIVRHMFFDKNNAMPEVWKMHGGENDAYYKLLCEFSEKLKLFSSDYEFNLFRKHYISLENTARHEMIQELSLFFGG